MKTFGFAILAGGACLHAAAALATPSLATPISASPSFAADGPPPNAATIQHVLYGDAPMPGRKHGGGGKRRESKKKDLSPGVPALNGATREDADKEYKKKYGF